MPLPDAAWRPLARPLRGKVRVDDPEPVDPFLQPTCGWWFPNWYVAQGTRRYAIASAAERGHFVASAPDPYLTLTG